MRFWFLWFFLPVLIYAENSKLLECNKIFEERKHELELKLEAIDEQQQAYEALKEATEAMMKRKEEQLLKKEQDDAIKKSIKRKIILSTNIAQTSLTIDGVKVVIDTGLEKLSRYNLNPTAFLGR